jgi:hypothetical protein
MKACYDLEVFPNFFSASFIDVDSNERSVFIVYEDKNELLELHNYVNRYEFLVGFNNAHYDNIILNYLILNIDDFRDGTPSIICSLINKLSQEIIADAKISSDIKYARYFKSIDLMKVLYLDKIGKGLKQVAVNLKWHLIQDLPYHFTHEVKEEEVDEIIKYNINDVEITLELYLKYYKDILLRKEIEKIYNVNVVSESNSGVANRILEKYYAEKTGIDIKEFKNKGTDRSEIRLDKCILPNIKFKTSKLNSFLDNIRKQVIKNQKADANSGWKPMITISNKTYQLGIGGIHSEDEPLIIEETDQYYIIDADVASYYPALMIQYEIRPEHIGSVFSDILKELRDERIKAKREGNSIKSDALKIVIVSSFGKMNSSTHWLRDPEAMAKVTVSGQLFLLMLIETLDIAGFEIISANTDGVTTKVPRDRYEEYNSICKSWEEKTSFELEYVKYKKLVRRDVNNYLASYLTNDQLKVKYKGVFEVNKGVEKGFHMPIIPMALSKYFVEGIPVEQTIRNHTDIYDFCTSQKTGSDFRNEFRYVLDNDVVVEDIQKTVRFYISKKGGTLLKINKTPIEKQGSFTYKEINYFVDQKVILWNNHQDIDVSKLDIDYNFYISECNKIINKITNNNQLTLF